MNAASSTTNTMPALHGYTVIEMGVHEAGQYAGRVLAGMGARVIKIEGLDGERTRAMPPFVHDKSGRRRSVPHEYLNAGKESVSVDLDDSFVGDLLRELSPRASVLLVSPDVADLVPGDLGIPVVMTGAYGASGPRARMPSTPFTRFHAGGSGYLIPAERPTVPGTLAGECFAGIGIVVAVLGMLLASRRDPALAASRPRVDHSEQAHAVNLEKMFVGRIAKHGVELTRDSHRYPFGGAVRCSDGHVSMLINEKHQWKGVCTAIGKPEWATDKRFETGSGRANMQAEIRAVLEPWCAARTVNEVLDAMRAGDVPIGSARSIGELVGNPTLRARGFLRDADTPYGKATVPGLPYGADALWQARPRAYAPVLGEHTASMLQELGRNKEQITMLENLALIRCEYAS